MEQDFFPTIYCKLIFMKHHYISKAIFVTESGFNYSTRKYRQILHKFQRYNFLVEKTVLFICYTVSARKLYSRTGCSLSAQKCDVDQNTSNTKKPAINRIPENQYRSNFKLHERGLILEISIEETCNGKLLEN
jgi:hypothetical protein